MNADYLFHLILELIRAVVVTGIFVYLLITGRRSKITRKAGWRLIIIGFGFLSFGMLIDVTDNFETLNRFVIIGDTDAQALIEKVVGYLIGFVLVALGFWKWIPKIHDLDETKHKLQELNESLEILIGMRTQELNKANHELQHKNKLLADSEIHLRHLVEEKTRKIEAMTHTLVSALENANMYNDSDTGGHIKRVSKISEIIADSMGLENRFVKKIGLYSSLHDIGKVGIPEKILKKPGRFNTDEFENMKKHVVIGKQMIDNPDLDSMVINIVLYHHERWDGSGYIYGLQKDEIPLEARIVAIADVYDALINRRVYKEPFSHEEAVEIILNQKGKHFDPVITDAFIESLPEINRIVKTYM